MSSAPPDTTPFAPRPFGDYLLTAELGRGGMGAVFLAKRTSYAPDILRFCAVKTLGAMATRSDFVRRFHDEARAVVTMNHPGICHVFDVGIVDGEHYLAMELIEGVSLQELQRAQARAGEPVPPTLALTIADAMLDALAYAHERRDPATGASLHLVHRDVTPQNVMLTFSGAVKLIDFGLAISSMKEERTIGGVVIGKIAYMAPEHARGEALDARADVYAAAIILYELLTGRRFYAGLSKNQIATHAAEGSYLPPLDGVPEALRAPLARALAPEVAARTTSCAALQRELYQAEPTRAPARELAALIANRLPDHATRFTELLRGAATTPTPDSVEVTRSVVTHVARSDEDADRRTTSATVPTPPVRARTFRRAALLASVAAVSAALTWSAWRALDRHSDDVAAGAPAAVASAPVLPPTSVTPEPPAVPPTAAAPSQQVLPAAEAPRAPDAGPAEPPRSATQRPARRPPAPPPTPLPDLAAQLDYLERWCAVRAPTCTRAAVVQRRRVPLLDAASLRALREEASACVLQCRR